MLELATDVCRDITRLPGNFQRCRKSYCRQPQTSSGNLRRWHASVSEMAASGVCDNERYQRTLENFGYLIQQRPFLVSMSMLAAPVAMTPFIAARLVTVCAALYLPFRRVANMQGTDTRFASSRPNIFSAFPIMARCRGSVTGNNLKPCFAPELHHDDRQH